MSEQYKIEKGIPLTPAPRCGRRAGSKYPVKEMEIGDSFLLTSKNLNSARSHMSKVFKANGVECAIRCEGEKFRVWRTK